MTYAIIADIHGNRSALEAVLADIDRRGITQIINLGDCVSSPLDAVGTADLLMAYDFPTVLGNHDRQLFDRPRDQMGLWEDWIIDDLSPDHLDWLKSIPKTLSIDDILFCHATPNDDDDMWLHHMGPAGRMVPRDLGAVADRLGDTTANLICCGHTHAPALIRLPDGPTIVNPGSVGSPAFMDNRLTPPFIFQMGSPDARYAIVEKSDDLWSADFIAVPYDPGEMAALARAKGVEDWARALETGWLV